MKNKNFATYFLLGAAIGVVVGLMKEALGIWIGVGAGLGLLVGFTIHSMENKNKAGPEKVMWLGFFLLFPIMFFSNQLEGSFWYDSFGILALIGSLILVINFVKMLRHRK